MKKVDNIHTESRYVAIACAYCGDVCGIHVNSTLAAEYELTLFGLLFTIELESPSPNSISRLYCNCNKVSYLKRTYTHFGISPFCTYFLTDMPHHLNSCITTYGTELGRYMQSFSWWRKRLM